MRSLLSMLLLLATGMASVHAAGISDDDIIKRIQQGSYVIFFRHAATDHSQYETNHKNLESCATQRNLSELGKRQSLAIGKGFKSNNIPVGEIFASPWCRAKDTANIGFGRAEVIQDLGFSISKSSLETERLSALLTELLSNQPQQGTNTLIFSHTSNLKEATGVWPKPEGVMVVFLPDQSEEKGYKYIGMIEPSYWLSRFSK